MTRPIEARRAASATATALSVRRLEIVEHECGTDLTSGPAVRSPDAVAADAGHADGSKVSRAPPSVTHG